MGKWIIGIIALVVILGGAYWYMHRTPTTVSENTTTPPVTQTQTPPQASLASGSDTSDTALAQDSAQLNSDMSPMSSDAASVDSAINDKSVQ